MTTYEDGGHEHQWEYQPGERDLGLYGAVEYCAICGATREPEKPEVEGDRDRG